LDHDCAAWKRDKLGRMKTWPVLIDNPSFGSSQKSTGFDSGMFKSKICDVANLARFDGPQRFVSSLSPA
jgi:hypothetical protein